jgi:uncharacterized protein DUF6869
MTSAFHEPPNQVLIEAWLANADASSHAHNVDRLARYVPEVGWRMILAILELPDCQAHLDALAHPLGVLIAQFGPMFIERIEAEAAISPPLRRCLAELQSDPVFRIPTRLWRRLSDAAAASIGPIPPHMQELHDDFPNLAHALHFDPRPIDPTQSTSLTADQLGEQAAAWVVYQQTFWAWEELQRLAEEEGPDAVWPLLTELVQQASSGAIGSLGAGLLEDLLREHGPAVIDRIEHMAAESAKFRRCLSHVWPVEMADGIWARVVKARGDEPQRG